MAVFWGMNYIWWKLPKCFLFLVSIFKDGEMSAGVEGCVLLWWCDGRQPSEKLTTLTGFDSARLSDWWTAVRSTAFKLEAFMKCLKFDWSTSYGQTCFILSFLNWLLNCRFYNVQLFGGQYNTALLDLSPILQRNFIFHVHPLSNLPTILVSAAYQVGEYG